MAQKRVLLSLPPELNERWNRIAKKHRLSKSAMVEHYLNRVLPQLDHINISDAEDYEEVLDIRKRNKTLFTYDERSIYEKSVADVKKSKKDNEDEFLIPFD